MKFSKKSQKILVIVLLPIIGILFYLLILSNSNLPRKPKALGVESAYKEFLVENIRGEFDWNEKDQENSDGTHIYIMDLKLPAEGNHEEYWTNAVNNFIDFSRNHKWSPIALPNTGISGQLSQEIYKNEIDKSKTINILKNDSPSDPVFTISFVYKKGENI